jgi:hypothetical protein
MVAPEKKKKGLVGKIVKGVVGGVFCLGIIYGTYDLVANHRSFAIRTNAKMQSGYVNPKKLDIELTDLDKNGENEVVLRYDGFRSYLLMEDERGNPVLRKYEVKPEEKVPAQYIAPEIIQK